jgi:hypothetical protein
MPVSRFAISENFSGRFLSRPARAERVDRERQLKEKCQRPPSAPFKNPSMVLSRWFC